MCMHDVQYKGMWRMHILRDRSNPLVRNYLDGCANWHLIPRSYAYGPGSSTKFLGLNSQSRIADLQDGGQKVNKTSSKATISLEPYEWLNPKICSWMPKPVLEQVLDKPIRYETKSHGLIIQSNNSRNRGVNTDECFKKLLSELKSVVYFGEEVSVEDKRKWDKLAVSQKEYRMKEKKRNSEKKNARSKKFEM